MVTELPGILEIQAEVPNPFLLPLLPLQLAPQDLLLNSVARRDCVWAICAVQVSNALLNIIHAFCVHPFL